jgi:uncharacterized membrane protein YphA (DoxX/SURF4 family)
MRMKDYALFFGRLVLGLAALVRGISETFGVWGGPRLAATTSDMASTAGVGADWLFYVVSIGLMVLGVAMLLGMLAPAAAWALLVVVVWHGIANQRFRAYFVEDQGCEALLAAAALCVVIATHGPGAWRVEAKSPKSRQ